MSCARRLRHSAEDLAQESLLRAFRNLAKLAEPEKFGPWLRGIAQRVCLDWLKAKQNSQVTFNALEANNNLQRLLARESNAGELVAQADEIRRLLEQLRDLPDELREVLMLYYYDDVTYRDLAELLGVSTATINARLTKARAMLRLRLNRVGRP